MCNRPMATITNNIATQICSKQFGVSKPDITCDMNSEISVIVFRIYQRAILIFLFLFLNLSCVYSLHSTAGSLQCPSGITIKFSVWDSPVIPLFTVGLLLILSCSSVALFGLNLINQLSFSFKEIKISVNEI